MMTLLPEAKAIFHKTRNFRPLVKYVMKERDIQKLTGQTSGHTDHPEKSPNKK